MHHSVFPHVKGPVEMCLCVCVYPRDWRYLGVKILVRTGAETLTAAPLTERRLC